MIKRFLTLLMLLCFTQVANAQSWGGGPGQQPVNYPGGGSGSYTGVRGDGSNSHGGTPPAYSLETANIGDVAAGYNINDWSATDNIQRVDASPNEEKVRFVCNSSHVAQADPILFPGQANAGHPHEFVGNTAVGIDPTIDTYAELRTNGGSTCPGGPTNRTAYWKPALMKDLGTGISVVIRSDLEVFYYTHPSGFGPRKTRIMNNFAFIGGKNPADPTNSARLAELPSGFAKMPFNGPDGDGFKGWSCLLSNGSPVNTVNGTATYPALQTPEGNDPWQGNCVAGSTMYAEVVAPNCWDGKNPTSPTGRDHVRYMVVHQNSGQFVCPDGWWEVMQFIAKSDWTVGAGGWDDYKHWYLSSDRYGLSEANWHRPGSTFHFDWMNGWDPVAIGHWQAECGGVTNVPGFTADPGECNSSTIGPALRLKVNEARPNCTGCAALSNDPIVNLGVSHWDDGLGRFYPPKQFMANATGHLHHGVPPVGTAAPVPNQRYVYAEGDSISLYTSSFYPYDYDQARQRVTVCGRTDNGGSGIVTGPRGGVANRAAEIDASSCGTAVGGPNVVTLLIGANDMPHAQGSQAAWFANIWAYTDAQRALGRKVVMGTILPKGPPISDYVSFNAGRAFANDTIRAAVGVHIDAVADFAANTTIGDDADGSNTTYYPDGQHPSAAAHDIMETIYGQAVDNVLLISKK